MQYPTLPICSTKQEYSPSYFKWSKYICIYVGYLFSNQPATTISGHPLNVSRGSCFLYSQQATPHWTWGSATENSQLLSHAQQDLPCLPLPQDPFVSQVHSRTIKNGNKMDACVCVCVFLSHLLSPHSKIMTDESSQMNYF